MIAPVPAYIPEGHPLRYLYVPPPCRHCGSDMMQEDARAAWFCLACGEVLTKCERAAGPRKVIVIGH